MVESASEPAANSNLNAAANASTSQPPPKRSGFKGKRRRTKFTRNARTWAQQKDSKTFRVHHASQVVPVAASETVHPLPHDAATTNRSSWAARKKLSNNELKGCLQCDKTTNKVVKQIKVSRPLGLWLSGWTLSFFCL